MQANSVPTTSVQSLLHALREGTCDLHTRIESRLNFARIFASMSNYVTVLERFYGLYSPLEKSLTSLETSAFWSELGIDYSSRRKADLLLSDLTALSMTASDISSLKLCSTNFLTAPISTADLIGCAYVVEGATLGGQIIERQWRLALNIQAGEPGGRFFHGYGLRTGTMWQEFRRAVQDFSDQEEKLSPGSSIRIASQAVAAARHVFPGMDAWLVDGISL